MAYSGNASFFESSCTDSDGRLVLPTISDISRYSLRSYTVTANKYTASRVKLTDMAVAVSCPENGSENFFPAIVDELVEFEFRGVTHRIARVIPYSTSSAAKENLRRMCTVHDNNTYLTSPITFVACTKLQRPLVREAPPLYVATSRIYGNLVTLAPFTPGSSVRVKNVLAVRGYFPWYKPGRHGCKRATMGPWQSDGAPIGFCV